MISQGFHDDLEAAFIGGAQHGIHLVCSDHASAKAHYLFQQRLAIAIEPAADEPAKRRPPPSIRNPLSERFQSIASGWLQLHWYEIIPLASRKDGDGDLFRIGGTEDRSHAPAVPPMFLAEHKRLFSSACDFVDDVDHSELDRDER